MALIKCSECSREVSDSAASCPGCGHPLAGSNDKPISVAARPGGKYEGIGFVLIAVGMIMLLTVTVHDSGLAVKVGVLAIAVGFIVFLTGRFK